jgi:hypothetical protein
LLASAVLVSCVATPPPPDTLGSSPSHLDRWGRRRAPCRIQVRQVTPRDAPEANLQANPSLPSVSPSPATSDPHEPYHEPPTLQNKITRLSTSPCAGQLVESILSLSSRAVDAGSELCVSGPNSRVTSAGGMAGFLQLGDIIQVSKAAWELYHFGWSDDLNAGEYGHGTTHRSRSSPLTALQRHNMRGSVRLCEDSPRASRA